MLSKFKKKKSSGKKQKQNGEDYSDTTRASSNSSFQRPPQHWSCPQCTLNNFGEICEACYFPRPEIEDFYDSDPGVAIPEQSRDPENWFNQDNYPADTALEADRYNNQTNDPDEGRENHQYGFDEATPPRSRTDSGFSGGAPMPDRRDFDSAASTWQNASSPNTPKGHEMTSDFGNSLRSPNSFLTERSLPSDDDYYENSSVNSSKKSSAISSGVGSRISMKFGRKAAGSMSDDLASIWVPGEQGTVHCWYVLGNYKGGGTPYMSLVSDLTSRPIHFLSSKKSEKLLAILRELCVFSDDVKTFDSKLYSTISLLLDKLRDSDTERKVARYLQYFLQIMADHEGIAQRELGETQISEALAQLEAESRHNYFPRRCTGMRVFGALCTIVDQQHRFMKTIEGPVQQLLSLPQPDKKMKKKLRKAYEQQVSVARYTVSALRRCPALLERQFASAQALLVAATTPNPISARHAFALLAEKAKVNPHDVASALHPHLKPTTVGVEVPSSPTHSDLAGKTNLLDELACVYYLKVCEEIVFGSSTVDDTMRLDFYSIIANSVKDSRPRVSLQAIRSMFAGEKSWDFLCAAMAMSRNDSMFQYVSQKLCQFFQRSSEHQDWVLAHSSCRTCVCVGEAYQRKDPPQLVSPRKSKKQFGQSQNKEFEEALVEQVRTVVVSIQKTYMLKAPNPFVVTAATRAMCLLLPDPTGEEDASWLWLEKQVISAFDSLPIDLLLQILNSIFYRITVSKSNRSLALQFYFTILEKLISTEPQFPLIQCLAESWAQALDFELPAATIVLGSIFRSLDIVFSADTAFFSEDLFTPTEGDVSNLPLSPKKKRLKFRRKKKAKNKVAAPNVMDSEAVETALEGVPEEMREATLWLRRTAFSLLGTHARVLSGHEPKQPAPPPVPPKPAAMKAVEEDNGVDLLDFASSEPVAESTFVDPGFLLGPDRSALEAEGSASLLAIIGRLKQGCLFEDDQVRSCCVKSLATIASDFGGPFKEDAASFLSSAFAVGGSATGRVTTQQEAWQQAECALENGLHELVGPAFSLFAERNPRQHHNSSENRINSPYSSAYDTSYV